MPKGSHGANHNMRKSPIDAHERTEAELRRADATIRALKDRLDAVQQTLRTVHTLASPYAAPRTVTTGLNRSTAPSPSSYRSTFTTRGKP